jgi:hypothetical protein
MGEPTPVQLFEAGAQIQIAALTATKTIRENVLAAINTKLSQLQDAKDELSDDVDLAASIQVTINTTTIDKTVAESEVAILQAKIDVINSVLQDNDDANKAFFYMIITQYIVPYTRWGFVIKPKLINMIRTIYENENLSEETKRVVIQAQINKYSPTSPEYD